MGNCKICKRFVASTSVTVVGTNLVINIPATSYDDCEKLCLYIGQTIPDTATINMPVVLTIGTDATQYPLVKCNCNPVTACAIRYRSVYPLRVQTTATSAVFRVLKGLCCSPANNLGSIPVVTAPAEGG